MKKLIGIFSLSCLISCSNPVYDNPHVLIETGMGNIELEIYTDKAPLTSGVFLKNVEGGLYDGGNFYRVLKAEEFPTTPINPGLIQGGIFNIPEKKSPGFIPHEPTSISKLSHTDGIVSMARKDTGTASTEFFICIGDQSSLDFGRRGTPDSLGMAAFSKVFKGMDVVKRIQSQQSNGDAFVEPVRILKMKRL